MALYSEFRPVDADMRGISLCAGYGGLDLGLHIAEPAYRTVCFVEREAHAAATLVARMADTALAEAPIWDDLKSFDGEPWRGRVHIVTAGYPCQPFSTAGLRAGKSDSRHLWPEVARIVDEAQPEWVFCENVEGHLTLGLPDVIEDLRRMGYRTKAGLFAAAETGASHRRNRLFILAHSNSKRCRLSAGAAARSGKGADDSAERPAADKLRPISAQQGGAGMDNHLAVPARPWRSQLRGSGGIFSPDPDQFQEWAELLAVEPAVQPAVFREDNGMAERVERIRAVGNGVCPMAAAIAWSVLKADFDRDMGLASGF
ncbi:MAG: DNA cytosine methyltransferase [Blastomonas sp.]